MVLSIFVKASDTSSRASFHKTLKSCKSKNNDDIANALSGMMANDLKYNSIYSVERIRQQTFYTLNLEISQRFEPCVASDTGCLQLFFICSFNSHYDFANP